MPHLVGYARDGVDDLVAHRAAAGPGRCRWGWGSPRPPFGTSAWRRLLAGIARPRDMNISRMASARSSRRSSAVPITSAIASRVMSSWVGPSPPQTITASASLEQRPQGLAPSGPGCRPPGRGGSCRCRRRRAARRSRRCWCRRSGRGAAPSPRRGRHISCAGGASCRPTDRWAASTMSRPDTTVRATATQRIDSDSPTRLGGGRAQRHSHRHELEHRLHLAQLPGRDGDAAAPRRRPVGRHADLPDRRSGSPPPRGRPPWPPGPKGRRGPGTCRPAGRGRHPTGWCRRAGPATRRARRCRPT